LILRWRVKIEKNKNSHVRSSVISLEQGKDIGID